MDLLCSNCDVTYEFYGETAPEGIACPQCENLLTALQPEKPKLRLRPPGSPANANAGLTAPGQLQPPVNSNLAAPGQLQPPVNSGYAPPSQAHGVDNTYQPQAPQVDPNCCSNCGSAMAPDAILCINCGTRKDGWQSIQLKMTSTKSSPWSSIL